MARLVGPEPPYHAPVFVLTHHAREPIEMEGGTTFHFVTDGFGAPRPPDATRIGGHGLRLVQTLSHSWGLERFAAGPTRVWAQLTQPAAITAAARNASKPPPDQRPRAHDQTPATAPTDADDAHPRDTMTDLHVIPDDRTTWRVCDDADAHAPLSEHTNATDAQRAAATLSQRHGGARVIVHDRYHRTHQPTPGLAAAPVPAPAHAAPAPQQQAIHQRTPHPADA